MWISLGILAIIIIAVYNHLGGFQKVKLEVLETAPYHMVGRYYEGKYDRDSLAVLFFEAKSWMQNQEQSGTLTVVNYMGDIGAENSDSVKTFIGVLFSRESPEEIAPYEYREIGGGKKLRASIEAQSIVMPTRETIEEKMKIFAQEKKFLLEPIIIEKYISDEHLVVESVISD